MSLPDALLVGYLPPLCGAYFEGLAIAAEAGRGAAGPLAAAAHERAAAIDEGRAGVVRNVLLAERLLGRAGAEAPERPQDLDGYYRWAEAALAAGRRAFAQSPPPPRAAQAVGAVLGEASLLLDLGALVVGLREVQPDHPWLARQAARLEGDRRRLITRLQQAAEVSARLPEAVRPLVSAAARLLERAPALDAAAPPRGAGEAVAEALSGLSDLVASIEEAMTEATGAATGA